LVSENSLGRIMRAATNVGSGLATAGGGTIYLYEANIDRSFSLGYGWLWYSSYGCGFFGF
jgi:hypothetical protein